MKITGIILIITFLSCFGLNAFSTDSNPPEFYLGTNFSFNYTMHSSIPHQQLDSYPSIQDTDLDGTGYSIGLNFRYPFAYNSEADEIFLNYDWAQSIIFEINYDSRAGEYERVYSNDFDYITENNDTIRGIVHLADYSLEYLTANFLYDVKLGSTNFSLFIGPSFSFLLSNEQNQALARSTSNEYEGGENDPIDGRLNNIDQQSSEIDNISSIHISMKTGLSYTFQKNKLFIRPSFSYFLGLSKLVDSDWKMNNLSVDISIFFRI